VWDPIGAGVPLDEYERYVVWKPLAERAEVDEIAARLDTTAEGQVGGVGRGRGGAGAERLSQWCYWRFEFPAEFEARS
jgi:hypothetical protein